MNVREGDVIHHMASDECWVVAGVYPDGSILCAGWPCTLAKPDQYEIKLRCDDVANEKMIQQASRIQEASDPRRLLAASKLEAMKKLDVQSIAMQLDAGDFERKGDGK